MTDISGRSGAEDAGSLANVIERLERLPPARFHGRARVILGCCTFFDAFDLLAMSFALPVLIGLWKLTPQDTGQLISAAFLGQLLGALAAGWLSERFGRLRVVAWSTVLFGAMSLACANAWNPTSLMAFRFIQGLGLGAEVPIATVYIMEILRSHGRGRFYILFEILFSIGVVACSLLGFWLVPIFGWKALFYVGVIPMFVGLALRRLLPESPRWLALQGRRAEADAVVRRIEAEAGGSPRPSAPALETPAPALPTRAPAGSRWAQLFRGVYRRRTLCIWALWFCLATTTYGLLGWLPSLYRTIFDLPLSTSLGYGLIGNVAGLLGCIACALTADRFGRKKLFLVAFPGAGGMLFLLALQGVTSAEMLLLFTSVALFFAFGAAILLNLYTPELYPTHTRGLGSAVAGSWQRVAAFLGPLAVGLLLPHYGLAAVFAYFGAVAVLGGLIVLIWAPETAGVVLD